MTQKMDKVYFDAAEKIQRTLERQYERKMMTGGTLKKSAQKQLTLVQSRKKDVSDIINSGLAQMDLENTYGELAQTSPRESNAKVAK